MLLVYAILICFFKKWNFVVECIECKCFAKVEWSFRDGIKDNSRLYYFVCGNCGSTICIKDTSLVMGSLPTFVVIEHPQSNDQKQTKRFLPTRVEYK
jgi:hypothetical protein